MGLLIAALALTGCGTTTRTPSLPAVSTATVISATTLAPFTAVPVRSAVPANTPALTAAAPAVTDTPAPSATAAMALHQMTSGGCCVQPFWSADSRQVRYIDRPSSGQPSGIWGVGLAGGAPVLVTARLGLYSPDENLLAYPEAGQTFVERVGGPRWPINNGGRAVVFSPDSAQIAWQAASSLYDFDRRRVEIWVAGFDGSGARKVADLIGGSLAGWFPDGRRLLVTARYGANTQVEALNLADGVLSPLASAARLQGLALSPAGGWLAYAVAFSGDASLDGLWVVPATGVALGAAPPAPRRLEVFGGFAWRSEGRLLIVPLDPAAESNRLLEVEATTGAMSALTDPSASPLKIAQGNWALAPDGSHLAFVSAADHNIWVINLAG